MNPETILQAITAVGNAATEGFKFAQTEEGQALLKQAREDRAAFDRFMREVGAGIVKFFTGKL